MVSEFSPHHACGQILFSLKNSKLNYVVRETPYSAYITIRKTFIKEVSETIVNVSEENKTLREINTLKDKNDTLERKLALVTFDFEEMEIKYEALDKENKNLDDQINNLYEAKRKVTCELESVSKENCDLKTEIKKVNESKTNLKVEYNKTIDQKKFQEKSDLVEILEHTLQNKQSEIERLRQELSNRNAELKREVIVNGFNVPCNICSFENEVELKRHIEEHHTHKCDQCNDVLYSVLRLESHVRIFHVWNCDFCEFATDTEDQLEDHRIEIHENECEHCDFETSDTAELERHIEEVHTHKCLTCGVTFKSAKKLTTHICKVDIRNPTFKSFYTRSWYDANGCNPVYCTIQNQDIAWLHCQKCWTDKESYCWKPSMVLGIPVEMESVRHIQSEGHLQSGEVNWPMLVKDIDHLAIEE